MKHYFNQLIVISILLVLGIGNSLHSSGQVNTFTSGYTLTTGNNASLAFDRNGNSINMSLGTRLLGPNAQDSLSNTFFQMGFPFYLLRNQPFQSFRISSNGMLTFSSFSIVVNLNSPEIIALSAFNTKMRTGSDGEVRALNLGTAPNRTVVVEWKNMQLAANPAGGTGQSTFQVRIYEADNSIEFVYGSMVVNNMNPVQAVLIGLNRLQSSQSASYFVDMYADTAAVNQIIANQISANQTISNLHSTNDSQRKFYHLTPPPALNPPVYTFSAFTGSAMVTWTDNESTEMGYILRFGTHRDSLVLTDPLSFNEVQRRLRPLRQNTKYFFQIATINARGIGPFSTLDSFVTQNNFNTYTWIASSRQSFYDPNSWSPPRMEPDTYDALIFNSGATDSVNVSDQGIHNGNNDLGTLLITNNTHVVFTNTQTSTFRLAGRPQTTVPFQIDSGSSLVLGRTPTFGTQFVGLLSLTSSPYLSLNDTVFIKGKLTAIQGSININGIVFISGIVELRGSSGWIMSFPARSRLLNGGQLINATTSISQGIPSNFLWDDGSTLKITGANQTAANLSLPSLFNLVWDSPNQQATVNLSNTSAIRGTLQIVNTGTGRVAVQSNLRTTNLELTGGELMLNNNLANAQASLFVSKNIDNAGGLISANPGSNGLGVIVFSDTSNTRQTVKLGNTSGPVSYNFSCRGGIQVVDSLPLRTNSRAIIASNASPLITGYALSLNQGAPVTLQFGTGAATVPLLQVQSNLLSTFGTGQHHLNVNNPAGANLNGINNSKWAAVTCQSGVLNLNTDTLIIGTDVNNPGTLNFVSGGFNNGTLRRWTPADLSLGAFEFPFVDNQRNRTFSFSPEAAGVNFSPAGYLSVTFTPGTGYFSIPLLANGLGAPTDQVSVKSWEVRTDAQLGLNSAGRLTVTAFTEEALPSDQFGHVLVKPANNNGMHGGAGQQGNGLMTIFRHFGNVADLAGVYRAGLRAVPVNEWNGTGNWNQTANWSLGVIPSLHERVKISSGILTMAASDPNKIVRDLFVEAGAQLIITNNDGIQVTDSVLNSGTIRLNTGGSIRCSKGYWGNGVYQAVRNGSTSNLIYNYWSSPNAVTTMSQLGGQDWYRFNNISQSWAPLSGNVVMQPGHGYIATGAGNVVFNGRFNHGTIKVPVSSNGNGFNLIGNPYPSSLGLASLLFDNAALAKTAYFWSQPQQATLGNSGGDYATWTILGGTAGSAGGAVPTPGTGFGQGFMVKALQTDTVLIHEYMSSMSSGSNFRMVSAERAWVNITDSQNRFNQILIGFADGASDQLDDMDGIKFKGNNEISLYSILGSDHLAIQAMAERGTATRIVPVGFDVATAGAYSLALDRTESMPANVDIFLKDNLTGSMHNLRNQAYGFAVANAGSFTNRFEIHFGVGLATSVNSLTAENVRIFGAGQSLFVQGFAEGTVVERFEVRDAAGRLVMELNRPQNADLERMEMNVAAGVYLARIVTNNGIKTERVYLSK
jgi:hypothetical protein